jgi:predicted PurR-regulated permease PerM
VTFRSADRRPVPVRTILATIGLVLATVFLLYIVVETRRVLTWIVVATFFAVGLSPAVDWVQRRLLGGRRRTLATLLVFLVVFVLLVGLIAVFVVPLVREGARFAGQLPGLIEDARSGRGPVGNLLQRTHALEWVQNNQSRISDFVGRLTAPVAGVVSGVVTGIATIATVLVLAYLMVLEGSQVVDGVTNVVPPEQAERIRRVGADCARSVTGYLSGNVLISLICGSLTYVALRLSGVPFAGLIALFVAVMDLVPLVGATIGGVVATLAGFIHSVPAGIAVLGFFVVYQLVENHLLQPMVFARTVRLNPLTVLIAILIGAELTGILGALLAIPVASMIQVILRDLWDHRRGQLKDEPTVGVGQAPALPTG